MNIDARSDEGVLKMKRWMTVLGLIAFLGFGLSARAAPDQGPGEVVKAFVSGIIDVLEHREDKTRLTDQDRERIRQIVNGRFDYAAMAGRSLGRTWKTLDEEERKRFSDLFRQLLEWSYGNRLNEYKGQRVEYRKVQFKGKRARVLTIVSDGAKNTPVEYRLHQTAHGWMVYDIRIEGASLVRTFYQEFQSQLEHGTYQQLVQALQRKIAKLKERG
ncbi:MAG: ABC transporter substrate-binding protein [Zetaproteobacteria bacterium]|nr:MAG: ABC transporter substrate-binding protein [Zetaproteobacteria bacterium]